MRTKVVTEECSENVVGSVLWSLTPVSPVTPLKVSEVVFPEGIWIVTPVGTVPPVGTVIVLAPEARVLTSSEPAEEEFVAAATVRVSLTSPENVIMVVRVEDTDIVGGLKWEKAKS